MQLSSTYSQSIDIIDIDVHRFDGLIVSERYPRSIYYRFLLPEVLPDEETVLYLDCDVIVRHSLRPLFEMNISAYALGAVVSQSCDWVKWANDFKLVSPFFNSGVLLINLDYWRKNSVFDPLIEWVKAYPKRLWLPDQSALNKVFEGHILYLNYTYNFQERWTQALEDSYIHFSRWPDIEQAGKDPVIVHFCEAEKPWFIESKKKFKDDFLYYATMHEFVQFQLKKRYGSIYKLASLLDKFGLKCRWLAEKWQNSILKKAGEV